MEKINREPETENREFFSKWEQNNKRGKITAGLIIIGIGCLLLARTMGVQMPGWLFTWQMLLITCGFYVGIKHAFRNIGWLIMVMVGSIFLIKEFWYEYDFSHYLWPAGLIIIGIYVMMRPQRRWPHGPWRAAGYKPGSAHATAGTPDEFIELTSVFGSMNRNLTSKNFRGGEVNCVFGSGEINLMQADINGTVELEINAVFGGARLIVPPHWTIKSELTAVMGGVEDKRPVFKDVQPESGKVLVLKGAAVFGGIEIKSY